MTVAQCVADIERLIEAVKLDLSTKNDVRTILWGTGFGGSLAIWAKQTFPYLINGVWSSSGIYERTIQTPGKCVKLLYVICC